MNDWNEKIEKYVFKIKTELESLQSYLEDHLGTHPEEISRADFEKLSGITDFIQYSLFTLETLNKNDNAANNVDSFLQKKRTPFFNNPEDRALSFASECMKTADKCSDVLEKINEKHPSLSNESIVALMVNAVDMACKIAGDEIKYYVPVENKQTR